MMKNVNKVNHEKQLSLLGLCKKANKLSMGHDACIGSIVAARAKACLLCTDASQRLKAEFERATSYDDRKIPLVFLPFTMEDIKNATGRTAAVITINDQGFARSFLRLEENNTGGNSIV